MIGLRYMHNVAAAFADVTARIAVAAEGAGRNPRDVTLVAVSKTRTVDETQAAIEAGARHLGENYIQELVDKHSALGLGPQGDLQWHAIGHVQRNKVKYITPFCGLIHSLDSTRLADEINRRAVQADRVQGVLIQVNIAREDTKFGVAAGDAAQLAEHVCELPNTQLRGLMSMTPYDISQDEARRHFAGLRELSQRLAANLPEGAMQDLSMGMTQDYETAVQEGATLVRVGTAIFGARQNTHA